jgi:type IV pilus assembly protein PilB
MVRITRMTRKRLGELLRDEGLVTDEQIEEALASQRKTGELLGEVLVRLGYVTEYDIAKTIVTQFGLPYIAVKQYFINEDAMKLFPERLMRQYQFIPMDKIGNVITIAVGGLLNFDVLSELENSSGSHIQVFVSTWSEIKQAIEDSFKSSQEGADADADAGGDGEVQKKVGEITDTALAEMELVAPGGDGGAEGEDAPPASPAPPAPQPAATEAGGGDKSEDDLTELGNLLLGDMDIGEGGSGGGG